MKNNDLSPVVFSIFKMIFSVWILMFKILLVWVILILVAGLIFTIWYIRHQKLIAANNLSKNMPPQQPPVQSVPPSVQPAPQGETKTSGFAITSLVLGIIAIFPNPFSSIILGILALIFGLIAKSKINKGSVGGKGISIAGIILGIIGIVMGIFMIVTFLIFLRTFMQSVPKNFRIQPSMTYSTSTMNYGVPAATN